MIMKIGKKLNVLGDNIGFVKLYDNSTANLNEENRINTVSSIASVCYNKESSKKPENLFKRLKEEAMGLPSSSFEFAPVLLTSIEVQFLRELSSVVYNKTLKVYQPHCLKFSEVITDEEDNSKWFVLTNLRALINDNIYAERFMGMNIENWYNNDVDADKIFKNYHLFKLKVPLFVRDHYVRHKTANFQVMSLRYVKPNKFEFYQFDSYKYDYSPIIKKYQELVKSGVKAEEARGILGTTLYTTMWIGMSTNTFNSVIKLRTDRHSQEPTRLIATAMQDLVKEIKGIEFPLEES
jgi:thymidylate synthase (FAD)